MALARVINKRHITHAILNRYVRVPKFTIPADLLNDLKAISAAPNPLVPLFELVLTDRNVGVLLEASGIDSAELLSNILRQTSTLSFLYDHDSLAPGESKYIKDEYIKLALAQRPRSSRSQVHGKAITDIITSLKDSRLLNPVISCHVNTTRAILVSAIHTMLFEGQIDQLPTHILILNLRKCYKSKSTDRCQRSFKPIYDFIRAKPSTVLFIKEFEKLLTVLDLDKECIARQIKFDIEFGALNCIGFMKFSSKEDGDMLIQKQRRRKVYKHYYVDAANLLTSFSSFKYGAIGNYV
ncbi:hypothetical protein EV182_006307 [Spiromyces aspiralis]|uniref:Uncharacterized protein n=1 Tax=Spiromyces aspiralis TaxID=68401 RepID=A0ACC1HM36_9FUNG|nr:hypothetical protein EV182_006307 [Spiromyces aspiralis]